MGAYGALFHQLIDIDVSDKIEGESAAVAVAAAAVMAAAIEAVLGVCEQAVQKSAFKSKGSSPAACMCFAILSKTSWRRLSLT